MARLPASIRYKNPGAMWGSPLAKKWGATQTVVLNDGKGQGNNIAVFPDYVSGICAQLDLWRSSKHYKNKRFADAIAIWSGHNSVESYIKFVLARVPGMTRDTVMNDAFWRSEKGIGFLKAQAWHEAGQRYPAPDADWIEAQRIVMGGEAPKLVPRPKPPVAPVPKPAPVEEQPKPAIKSKSIWAAIMSFAATLGGALTDWKVAAVIIAGLLIAFVIWDIRSKRSDIGGWFK